MRAFANTSCMAIPFCFFNGGGGGGGGAQILNGIAQLVWNEFAAA